MITGLIKEVTRRRRRSSKCLERLVVTVDRRDGSRWTAKVYVLKPGPSELGQ